MLSARAIISRAFAKLVSRDKSFDLRLPLDDVKECVKAIKEKIAQMLEF